MSLYEKILIALLNETSKLPPNPNLVSQGLEVKSKIGVEYKVVDVNDDDPNNLLFKIARADWESEFMPYDELKKYVEVT